VAAEVFCPFSTGRARCDCPSMEERACIIGEDEPEANPYTAPPEPSKMPTRILDELADREAARYEDDIVKGWDRY
jgi:hypothetical protein